MPKIKRKKMSRIKCASCLAFTNIETAKLGKTIEDGQVTLVKLPHNSPVRCKQCRKIFKMEVDADVSPSKN